MKVNRQVNTMINSFGQLSGVIIIIIRCQIWNRHWRPCLSKHLCHQTTSKNLNPYFVHLLPSYKDYQEMLFVVCPYRVCLLLYQLKIRIPSLLSSCVWSTNFIIIRNNPSDNQSKNTFYLASSQICIFFCCCWELPTAWLEYHVWCLFWYFT